MNCKTHSHFSIFTNGSQNSGHDIERQPIDLFTNRRTSPRVYSFIHSLVLGGSDSIESFWSRSFHIIHLLLFCSLHFGAIGKFLVTIPMKPASV